MSPAGAPDLISVVGRGRPVPKPLDLALRTDRLQQFPRGFKENDVERELAFLICVLGFPGFIFMHSKR